MKRYNLGLSDDTIETLTLYSEQILDDANISTIVNYLAKNIIRPLVVDNCKCGGRLTMVRTGNDADYLYCKDCGIRLGGV